MSATRASREVEAPKAGRADGEEGAFLAPPSVPEEPRSRVTAPCAALGGGADAGGGRLSPPMLPVAWKRRAWWLVGGLLCGLAPVAAAQTPVPNPAPPQVQTALYGGTLFSLEQDGAGTLHRGTDLFTLRLTLALPLPGGIRLAGRGDLTSLAALDPSNLNLASVKTVESYGALSWSRPFAGFDLGLAAMAGALIPVENELQWRYQPTYGAGARLGRGRSWLYVLAGHDGASDEACFDQKYGCINEWRAIVAGSIEVGRVALVGDLASGIGGRKRLGVLVRIPMIGGGQ